MPSSNRLIAAGRASPLSQVQIQEVACDLGQIHPEIEIEPLLFATKGDIDQSTSLRLLDKCNFFTREIDAALLESKCRIAIHSAKDLPEPLEEGLEVVALTRGIDSRDSLVLREQEALCPGMRIATSSIRREEAVRSLCPDLEFVDIRGAIATRIAKLHSREVDGVVIAKAALLRLGLGHLNHMDLLGDTAPYQGQLAVLARAGDEEMKSLFAPLDVRQDHHILYLGLDPSRHILRGKVSHLALIEIVPLETGPIETSRYSHILFTSKSAVHLFPNIGNCKTIAIGEATANALRQRGIEPERIAEEESSEGVAPLLEGVNSLLWPHSALSRRVIPDFCKERSIALEEIELYTTRTRTPESLPKLEGFDEIAFTSPSTVRAFFEFYGELPKGIELWTQGESTRLALLAANSVQVNSKTKRS